MGTCIPDAKGWPNKGIYKSTPQGGGGTTIAGGWTPRLRRSGGTDPTPPQRPAPLAGPIKDRSAATLSVPALQQNCRKRRKLSITLGWGRNGEFFTPNGHPKHPQAEGRGGLQPRGQVEAKGGPRACQAKAKHKREVDSPKSEDATQNTSRTKTHTHKQVLPHTQKKVLKTSFVSRKEEFPRGYPLTANVRNPYHDRDGAVDARVVTAAARQQTASTPKRGPTPPATARSPEEQRNHMKYPRYIETGRKVPAPKPYLEPP